jgi:hypothetical protein
MEKPVKDRLHWLAWFDADTMNINPLVPLETFLPPRICRACTRCSRATGMG